ncbi:hypothetical protein Zmor_003189 [Zophobas morio]|uniref:FAD-binding PCMH-type domain-containing protein n=1 Tax=Zophobas morio TaxID=2755281 RepID=A0AA38HRK6_9CUCU|nr:hypothetical protein Zmor_003189 [Zophobas morio]
MGAEQSTVEDDSQPATEIKKLTEVKFHLQGVEHVAKSENITPNTSLNFYLRNILKMTGTKAMCLEGGCGACLVVLQNKDPITQKDVFLAVNSCLIPLLSCNGWKIFTIEGIGNSVEGFHPLQEVLARFNGTQCGFCSPGMVMNMYALYESGKLTMQQVENSFSGNTCRCTGYRSILTAFKSLCTDADFGILRECPDVEDLVSCYKERCARKCSTDCNNVSKEPFLLELGEIRWIKVHSLKDLLRTLRINPQATYRLVAGNTAQGVYRSYKDTVDLYIDVTEVPELKDYKIQGDTCMVGGNITLTIAIEFFNEVAKSYPSFSYLKAVADHIDLVANVPVRNRATIAGNLIIKHDHHDFPSDIFLILETVGATITLVNVSGQETNISPIDFINCDLRKEPLVIKTINLPSFPTTFKYISYKIMPRAQNVHALVNAGFVFKFDNSGLLQSATIVYGNISVPFVHANVTERLLAGKNLFDNSVLQQVYTSLTNELDPDVRPPDPSPEFRKKLAISLFYKAVLSIAPSDKMASKNKSGGAVLQRPISTGSQDYEYNKQKYPWTSEIPKLGALSQTSGETKYVIDLPDLPFQLYGALVLAKAPANSVIRKINPDGALGREDIVAFYSKDDIPGDNVFTILTPLTTSEEQLFCDGRVRYYDQPIGILVGKSQEALENAVSLVLVTYDSPNVEPLLTSRQVVKEGRTDRITQYKKNDATRRGNDVKHVVKGSFDIYQQYHFHMENQCCQAIPEDKGLLVYASTQWMDLVQCAISRVLGIPESQITVMVRHCGGAFGGKITRASLIACATALAAYKLKKPVKMWLPLTTNMTAIGKRFPLSTDYEVGLDDNGVFQYANVTHYTDVGSQFDEDISPWFEQIFQTIYTSDTFTTSYNRVVTDTATNTWTRAPGSVEGLAAIESIMEHCSYASGIDPIQIRTANFSNQTPILTYMNDMKTWANIDKRKADIATFNKENRWKKKGLAVIPMSFDVLLLGPHLATVSIFHGDGSVQISHGGIEVGQGINTKAAQVCAYKFGIPLEKVTILPSHNFISPNNLATGGTIATDGVTYGIVQACDTLLERMKPYRTEGAKWEDIVKTSHDNFVVLKASGLYTPSQPGLGNYRVYGVCAAEVIVDILTGQHIVTRVDLTEDTGISMNPILDVGQAEGALIMGLGYQTTEKIVFSYEGKVLTNNTWTYYPPGAKDIPVEFNVKFPKDNPNPVGVLKSKGTGEPAITLAIAIPLAIRNALASARKDADQSNPPWYRINGTTDVENVLLHTLSDPSQYVL